MNPPPLAEGPATEPSPRWDVPFLDLLRVQPVHLAPGRGRLKMRVGPEHLRHLQIMHGGVLASLLDSAMGMAAEELAPAGHFVVTVQLNLNFIRPAWEGETLVAMGEVRHSGRQTAVAQGEVHTEGGALVGIGTATFMYVPHTDPARGRFARDEGPPGPADAPPSPREAPTENLP